MIIPGSDWERRMAALWDASEDFHPRDFLSKVEELAGELPPGHAIAEFELGSANDSIGREAQAEAHYRRALAAGLSGTRRRQAAIQLASTLRNLGRAEESIAILVAEREARSDDLDDAVTAFLALALTEVGRDREAAALALGALSRHLPRYNRSLSNYAEALTRADERPWK
ncbi:tetratricopeptide repeat protein [Actinomadura roseirufa]|uniref:tetratricopeptide repeat protein n=1 Tax=Actinomadura roseirufa TaxID=2094049 RepID=UPI0010418D28|nr:tetratricopeptide repeat protein [Actinomadura roseirufa]